MKYGFGLNTEQEVTESLRLFGRFGWNEDQHESFAYTEVGQTILFGGDFSGHDWHRQNDKVGAAFVSNAIKRDHQNYLHYGGLGFLLGDGNLTYGREDILEWYYNAHVWHGLYGMFGGTEIAHPGYNTARGPGVCDDGAGAYRLLIKTGKKGTKDQGERESYFPAGC